MSNQDSKTTNDATHEATAKANAKDTHEAVEAVEAVTNEPTQSSEFDTAFYKVGKMEIREGRGKDTKVLAEPLALLFTQEVFKGSELGNYPESVRALALHSLNAGMVTWYRNRWKGQSGFETDFTSLNLVAETKEALDAASSGEAMSLRSETARMVNEQVKSSIQPASARTIGFILRTPAAIINAEMTAGRAQAYHDLLDQVRITWLEAENATQLSPYTEIITQSMKSLSRRADQPDTVFI